MEALVTAYAAGLVLSGVATTLGAIHVWLNVARRWPRYLAVSAVLWAIGALVFVVSDSPEVRSWMIALRGAALSFLPVLALLCAVELTGRSFPRLDPRGRLLWLIPAVTAFLFATGNPLLLGPCRVDRIAGFYVPVELNYGPWHLVYSAYSYGLLLLSAALIISWWARTLDRFRSQVIVLAAVFVGPLTVHFAASLLWVIDLARLDLAAATLWMSVPAWLWLAGRYSSTVSSPLARDLLLDWLRDAILVVDAKGDVIESNAALDRLDDRDRRAIVAESTRAVQRAGRDRRPEPDRATVHVRRDREDYSYEVATTPALVDGDVAGFVVVARDVSRRAQLVHDLELYDEIVATDLTEPLANAITELRNGELDRARDNCMRALRLVRAHLQLARRGDDGRPPIPLEPGPTLQKVIAAARFDVSARQLRIETAEAWPATAGDPL